MAKNGIINRRSPLTQREKELMMMVLVRKKSAFLTIRDKLLPEHFGEFDIGLATVWASVLDYFQEFNRLPHEDHLIADIEKRIGEADDAMTDTEIQELDVFISTAYQVPLKKLNTDVALKFCQQFLQDHLTVRAQETFSAGRDTPTDLAALLSDMSITADHILAIQGGNIEMPFSDSWAPTSIGKWSTNMAFIDKFLNGGNAPKECYGLLGPFGSCKTTLMIQMSIEAARYHYTLWKENTEKSLGLIYYLQYEEAIDPDIKLRALSFAGKIDRTRLEEAKGWETLTRSGKLLDYERKMYSKQIDKGVKMLGEYERAKQAQSILNRNWLPVDMSGGDPKALHRGDGLSDEIGALIRNSLAYQSQLRGHPVHCAAVYVDFVGAACERHIEARNLDRDRVMRHAVTGFPLHFKRLVLRPFDCVGWLAHQFNGGANNKSPGTVLHHSDAAEAKSFGQYLDACFTIGAKDSNECCVFARTKGRRMASRSEVIIRVDGALSRVCDTEGAYVLDRASRQIVDSREYYRAGGQKEKDFGSRPIVAGRDVKTIGG